tara:strand:+ start:345 stop:533 length:189 start_codon:yes stop_codon:yes gene_type:complete
MADKKGGDLIEPIKALELYNKLEKDEKRKKLTKKLKKFGEGGGVCRGMGRAYMGEPRKVKIR